MTSQEPRTVLIASADRLFGEAVADWFATLDGWQCVGLVRDGMEALAVADRVHPWGVIVIGELPRVSSRAIARRLREREAEIRLVVVGTMETPDATVVPESTSAGNVLELLSAGLVAGAPPDRPRRADLALLASLTPRERQTLMLLARGHSREDVATQLGTRLNTVRTHMQNLYAKLGVHNRVELIRFAAELGIVRDASISD
jgi:DNA-binding NarL/FixJ family response regulator